MKITKFGHCCLLIEDQGVRILTDPGTYSTIPSSLNNINIVLITHEHADHYHIDSVKEVLKNSPKAKIVTNNTVGELLKKEGLNFTQVEDQNKFAEGGVLIEGIGIKHAQMHSSIPASNNTGYFISQRLFYPGDAFTDPRRPVEILALPVVGPWMKLSEAIDYALLLKPKVVFPVHDGILRKPGMVHKLPAVILPAQGINFIILEDNTEKDFK